MIYILPRFVVVLCIVLMLNACASGPKLETVSDIPELKTDMGRVYFYGQNIGWLGVLRGVTWEPKIALNNRVIQMEHGTRIVFFVDVTPGQYALYIDDIRSYDFSISESELKYLKMRAESYSKDGIFVDWRMSILDIPPPHAQGEIKKYKWLGEATLL